MSDHDDDIALDRLFASARAEATPPDAAFLARLEAVALAGMPVPAPVPRRRPLKIWGLFAVFASTAAVGVWIGIALPETMTLPGVSEAEAPGEITAFLPGLGTWALDEEG